jgi:hypothetical protein
MLWNCGLDPSDSGEGQVARFCAYGNEPSDSTKCGELTDWTNITLWRNTEVSNCITEGKEITVGTISDSAVLWSQCMRFPTKGHMYTLRSVQQAMVNMKVSGQGAQEHAETAWG